VGQLGGQRQVQRVEHARAVEGDGGDSLARPVEDARLGQIGHTPRPPRISRAMTMRWISDVPSPISVSLASRKMRSMGNSVMYPAPPWICTALVAAFIAASDANTLAIDAARLTGSP